MQPVRIGIVGVGALGLRVLAHLVQDDVQDRVRVQALCDPVLERAKATAEQHDIPQYFADLDELLANGDIDAVTIASPIGLHYEQCMKVIEAGKHLHVNKTMTTTVEEADAVIAAAAAKGVRIVASPGETLLPQVKRVRELIAEGAIGKLCWAMCGASPGQYHENEADRLTAPGGQPINPGWYFRKPGGGPMYDVTVYALHRLTSVLGPAKRVTAFSGQAVASREFMGQAMDATADDNTIGLLDFGDSVYTMFYGTPSGMPTDEVGAVRYFGTSGAIDGRLLNGEPFDFPGKDYVDQAGKGNFSAPKCILPHTVGVHRDLIEPHVFEDVMQLVDWVREDITSPVTAEHARHVIDIIESGYRSAETGQTQQLRTTF